MLESTDPRVVHAARALHRGQICRPVLLNQTSADVGSIEVFGNLTSCTDWQHQVSVAMAEAHQPAEPELPCTWASLCTLERGAWLLKLGYVDAVVAGAISTTADVVRAGLRVLGTQDAATVSGFFLLRNDREIVAYADCAVIPDPTSEQLARIAIDTATNYETLVGVPAAVAFLSFSTKGSAKHRMVSKVTEAVAITRGLAPDLNLDGELQFDSAVVPDVAQRKVGKSTVAGRANVFIFPNLDAANIGYKIMQRAAGADAIGPILQGFDKPWLDLSRGASASLHIA